MIMHSESEKQRISTSNAFFICLVVAVYSLSGVFTKQASKYDFLSLPYLGCLLGVVSVFAIYAVLWQIALKRVPLSRAYLFRSLGVIYGLALAAFVFNESISWTNLLGGLIVLFGLIILLSEGKK